MQQSAQARRAVRTNDRVHVLLQDGVERATKHLAYVVAGLHDTQVGGAQHQQGAMRLNATGRSHRFAIAVGDVQAVPHRAVVPAVS